MIATSKAWIAALASVSLIGCQQSDDTMLVSGAITIDGEPAPRGSVTIIPFDPEAERTGTAIEGGKYQARAPLGRAKVAIRVPKVVGQIPARNPHSPARPVMEESLPPRFNSQTELVIDVQPGDAEHNFDLTSR